MLLRQVISLSRSKHQFLFVLTFNLNFICDHRWESKELKLEVQFVRQIFKVTKRSLVT